MLVKCLYVSSEGNAFTININKILFVVLPLGEDFFHRLPMKKRRTFQQFCGQMTINSEIQSKWATTLPRLTSSSVIDGNDSPKCQIVCELWNGFSISDLPKNEYYLTIVDCFLFSEHSVKTAMFTISTIQWH